MTPPPTGAEPPGSGVVRSDVLEIQGPLKGNLVHMSTSGRRRWQRWWRLNMGKVLQIVPSVSLALSSKTQHVMMRAHAARWGAGT